MERLTYDLAAERGLIRAEDRKRPIRIVQFGEGNFLRAFVDWTVQKMNDNGLFNGNVAVIQPLPVGRVAALEEQDRLYTVVLEGLLDGKEVRERTVIDSIGATVNVYEDWDGFLALADDPDVSIVVSNTTEAGIALSDEDEADARPPKSYPAKLALFLKRRYDKGMPGLLIMPCELIADNGAALRDALVTVSHRFGWDERFVKWLTDENTYVNTLVDRIVPGYPADKADELAREFGYRDENMVKAEPFLLWVVAGDEEARTKVRELFPADRLGIDVVTVPEVQPYRERKVFLLNGPHTTMAQIARLIGLHTVGDVMNDPAMRSFIEREMHEEIIPVLKLPREELDAFADAVLERFSNPFVRHSLDSIALNSVSKFKARLLPIVKANVDAGNGVPARIALALAALLASYSGLAPTAVHIQDDERCIERLRTMASDAESVRAALADVSLWGEDLTSIDGFADAVEAELRVVVDGNLRHRVSELA